MVARFKDTRASRSVTIFLALFAIVVGLLGQPTAATAAPASPYNLRSEANAGVAPTFSWDAGADSTRFEIQIARDLGFQQLLANEGTVNTSYVPRSALPAGTVYWRVRSVDTAGAASAFSNSSYSQPIFQGPTPSTPANGGTLTPPIDSVKLTWSPVAGAAQYEVQISRNNSFSTYEYRADVRSAAYVLPELPVAGTWYWRVQARLSGDVNTEWSSVWSYTYGQLAPVTRVSPIEDAVIQDSVVSWSPVPGASSYDIQISTDENFQANSLVDAVDGIVGTTYARPGTLNNDQYYWRVRTRDANNNVQDWSTAQKGRFERAWPDQPDLISPANNATIGDPISYEWSPIRHASRYELQLASDANFNNIASVCSTTATFYIPSNSGDCMPGAGLSYYWRVIAHDEFSGTPPRTADTLCPVGADPACESIEVRRFTYNPDLVTLLSPTSNATVTLPTLTWAPFAGAARYRVTISLASTGQQVVNDVTATTSYTPRAILAPGQYHWDVIAITQDGREGLSLLPIAEPRFTVVAAPAATALSPEPLSPLSGSFGRFPTLRWDPVATADRYQIWLRPLGRSAWDVRGDFSYPAGEETTTTFLAADTYEWRVEAFNQATSLGVSNGLGRFTIAPPSAITGHKVALTTVGLAAGQTCASTLPNQCENLRQTPVLNWAPLPDAGYYKLYIARDRALTNPLPGYNGISVLNTRWTPTEQFEDSQAGSAYYWLVVPCKVDTACGPKTSAGHAFNKLSNTAQLVSPGVEKSQGVPLSVPLPEAANAVTLKWNDYLATNATAPQGSTVLATKATIEARQYRIQVSQDENFQSLVDDRLVDQLQYTAFDRTYPEGPLYWRVQAYDGSNRQLSWSPTFAFRKASPAPTPSAPAESGVVSGSVTLNWQPLPFSSSYEVEIYRNNDRNASPANRVASGGTRQVSWATVEPLPVSDQPYVWRVRRRDASNREGDWSMWRSFIVRDEVPELVSPAAGTRIHPTRTTFTWRGVTGASRYLWQWRLAAEPGVGEQIDTQALAYAPIRNLPDGIIEWRVLPLDARNEITVRPADRDSLWRRFTVGNAPLAVSPPQISGSPQVGSVLVGTAPSWLESGVSTTYQWLRDSVPIPGATSLSYQTVRDDLTRTVSLRAFGNLAGFSQATTNSNSMVISSGPAPTLAGSLLISSPGRVGDIIQSPTVAWNESGVTTAIRWMLDGKDLADAANPLTLTSAYVGKSVTVRAIGRRDGYSDADVQSNPIVVLPGAAAIPSSPVSITGKPAAGETLSVSGTWSNQPQLSYQWMVDGAPVAGEVGANYRVRATDAARSVSASVVAKRDGYETGGATTPAVVIAKLASTTEVGLSAPTATKKTVKKVKVSVTVRVPEVPGPVGSIKVYDGKKVIKTVKLSAARQGVTLVKVGKLKKGKHKIKAVFLGTPAINGSSSKVVKLIVTK